MILYKDMVFATYSFTEFGNLRPEEAQPTYYEGELPLWNPSRNWAILWDAPMESYDDL